MSVFEVAAILVGISALFGYVNHRFLRLPHTIGLVLIALAASLVVVFVDVINPSVQIASTIADGLRELDFNETLMHGILSFLLFAGAMHVNFTAFRKRAVTIGVMATAGTLISTLILGVAPLIQDAFWVSMALVMMFGLMFGTILTVILIPTFYATFYKMESPS